MATINDKLKKLRSVKSNPDLALFQLVQRTETQLNQEIKEFKKQLEKLVEQKSKELEQNAKKTDIFKGGDNARKAAEAVANEKISVFKAEVNGQIGDVLQRLEQVKTDTLEELHSAIKKETQGFNKSSEELRQDTERKLSEIRSVTDKELRGIIENVKTMRGPKGEKGDKGDKGQDGTTPVKGKDFFTEADVEEVKKKTLLEITAEFIRDKLASLKGDNRLDIGAIKGLDEKLKNIQDDFSQRLVHTKRGGAGMGNVQDEVHDVGSSTTTISTNHPIGQGGTSIVHFVLDNADLELTNHYTVGSDRQTITFDSGIQSQLVDNMKAHIIYVRG